MAELQSLTSLRNTEINNQTPVDDDSTIERVLNDIERLMTMLTSDGNVTKPSLSTNMIHYSSHQGRLGTSFYCQSPSMSMTNVTMNDDSHRIIEHLRQRVSRLEYERNVLLTSYQLLIKLLK